MPVGLLLPPQMSGHALFQAVHRRAYIRIGASDEEYFAEAPYSNPLFGIKLNEQYVATLQRSLPDAVSLLYSRMTQMAWGTLARNATLSEM